MWPRETIYNPMQWAEFSAVISMSRKSDPPFPFILAHGQDVIADECTSTSYEHNHEIYPSDVVARQGDLAQTG